jgi:hypothetical protein
VAMKLQKEAASESDVLDMVANPVRFVTREESDVGVAGRGVPARMATARRPRKEKGVTVVVQTSLATDT